MLIGIGKGIGPHGALEATDVDFVLLVGLLPHPMAPLEGREGLPVFEDGRPRGKDPGVAPAW